MSVSILVATPHTAFGELLRISLEDSGQYRVRLVQSEHEVRECASNESFHLAILDAALGNESFIPLCSNFLEQQAGVRLVIIPPDNNPNHPALGGLLPHGYLSRPFYLPELIELVSRLIADREKQLHPETMSDQESNPDEPQISTIPPWLQEPMTLNNYLEKQLPATQAIAAVVGMNVPNPNGNTGRGTSRASAGILSEDAVQELTEIVFRYWNQAEKTDLMRYIRLNFDRKDFLIYATLITGELVLVLVYDTSAPISQVRPQTKALAQKLATLPPNQGMEEGQVPGEEEPAGISDSLSSALQPGGSSPKNGSESLPSFIYDFDESDEPVPPASDEPVTQPLDDNMLNDRLYKFSSPAPANAKTTFQIESPDRPEEEETVEPSSNLLPEQQNEDPGTGAESLAKFPEFDEEEGENEENEENGSGMFNLSTLLGAVPSPDPERDSRQASFFNSGWVPERSAGNSIPTLSGGLNGNSTNDNETEREQQPKKKNIGTAPLDPQTMPRETFSGSPALPVDYSLPAGPEINRTPNPGTGRPASLEVKTEPPVIPPGISAPVEPLPSVDPISSLVPEAPTNTIEDTRPNLVSTVNNLDQLEHASPALSLLNYTCVLIPRLPQHYLTGELADRMGVWVQQLCLAFGWRLEGLSIRPEYLQWTVQVAPAISPGNLVRIVRQRTSMHVFGSYPHLADQNPSGDFWATGYLIVSGVQPPSAQLLRDYIEQTRKRQGVSK